MTYEGSLEIPPDGREVVTVAEGRDALDQPKLDELRATAERDGWADLVWVDRCYSGVRLCRELRGKKL